MVLLPPCEARLCQEAIRLGQTPPILTLRMLQQPRLPAVQSSTTAQATSRKHCERDLEVRRVLLPATAVELRLRSGKCRAGPQLRSMSTRPHQLPARAARHLAHAALQPSQQVQVCITDMPGSRQLRLLHPTIPRLQARRLPLLLPGTQTRRPCPRPGMTLVWAGRGCQCLTATTMGSTSCSISSASTTQSRG